MLADFGLSRIMEEEKLNMLTEICGTPGVSIYRGIKKLCSPSVDWVGFFYKYMAPEIFKKS